MWCNCAHILDYLTKLCPNKANNKWTDVEQNYFISMNKIVGRDVLISYLNFSEELMIHKDASKMQLRVVMIQNWNLITFTHIS